MQPKKHKYQCEKCRKVLYSSHKRETQGRIYQHCDDCSIVSKYIGLTPESELKSDLGVLLRADGFWFQNHCSERISIDLEAFRKYVIKYYGDIKRENNFLPEEFKKRIEHNQNKLNQEDCKDGKN